MYHTMLDYTLRRDQDYEVAIGWESSSRQFGAYVLARPGADDQEMVFSTISPQPQALIDELRRYADIPDDLEQRLWADYLFDGGSPGSTATRPARPDLADREPGGGGELEDDTYRLSWPTLDDGAGLG